MAAISLGGNGVLTGVMAIASFPFACCSAAGQRNLNKLMFSVVRFLTQAQLSLSTPVTSQCLLSAAEAADNEAGGSGARVPGGLPEG